MNKESIMDNWDIIENAPRETKILLMKQFENANTPCVIIGEVIKFNGKMHHLWSGAYEDVVDIYNDEVDPEWDRKFTHWKRL